MNSKFIKIASVVVTLLGFVLPIANGFIAKKERHEEIVKAVQDELARIKA